jgi:hypothetical protein
MPRVLSVGNCGFDHSNLSSMLADHFGADVLPVAATDRALGQLQSGQLQSGQFDLVIVNRIFDETGEAGIAFIERMMQDIASPPPVMLLSNFPEAQAEAIALGAVAGFGKAAMTAPETIDRLAAVLS